MLAEPFACIKTSATLAINQEVSRLRSEGKEIVSFGFGQSPFPVHDKIQSALKEHVHHNEYLDVKGLKALRVAISRYHQKHFQVEFKPENIIIGPGSKELLFQAIFVLQGTVLLPTPCWVSYPPQVRISGKQLIYLPTTFEQSYKITPHQLDQVCETMDSPETKIMVLTSPCNPTGCVYTRAELQALADVCRRHQVIVISDEIYAQVSFQEENYTSMASMYPEGTLVTSGMSKGFSAGGYRLGYVLAPTELESIVQAICGLASETYSAVSAPIQFAALAAYTHESVQDYIQLCTQVHKAASQYLYQRFCKMGLRCAEPMGSFYVFPDFSPYRQKLNQRGIQTASELCHAVMSQCSVALLPACEFGYDDRSLGCRVSAVDYDGTSVIQAAQTEHIGLPFIESHCPNLKLGCDRLESWLGTL